MKQEKNTKYANVFNLYEIVKEIKNLYTKNV